MLFLCTTSTNEYSKKTDALVLDQLLAEIAAQNTVALAQLYNETRASVYSFALSILKNTYDAEDVLQDCFIQIYAAAGDYKSVGKPLAWILTITKNLCFKKLREQKKTESNSVEILQADFKDTEVTPEDKIMLQACMQCLSDEERQIVVLHAVAGFRHREIAKLLSMHLSTVLSKYNRALKKLENLLTKGAQDK